jgi:hypothetical protein
MRLEPHKQRVKSPPQRAQWLEPQWHYPEAEASGPPAVKGGVYASVPFTIGGPGVQAILQLVQAGALLVGGETGSTDVYQLQVLRVRLAFEQAGFPGAKGAGSIDKKGYREVGAVHLNTYTIHVQEYRRVTILQGINPGITVSTLVGLPLRMMLPVNGQG